MEYQGTFTSAIRTSDFYGDFTMKKNGDVINADLEFKGAIACGEKLSAYLKKEGDRYISNDIIIEIKEETSTMISGIYGDPQKIDCGMFQAFIRL